MSKCEECGEDHDHDAVTAALAFEKILHLVSTQPQQLSPDVMLHVVGLMGAMLIRYSDFEAEDVFGEIARILENDPALVQLHDKMVKAGLAGVKGH